VKYLSGLEDNVQNLVLGRIIDTLDQAMVSAFECGIVIAL